MDPNVQYTLTIDEIQLAHGSILCVTAELDNQKYIDHRCSIEYLDISGYHKTVNIVREALKNKNYHIRETPSGRLEVDFRFVEDGIPKSRLFYLELDIPKKANTSTPDSDLFFKNNYFDLLKENETLECENLNLKYKLQL